MGISCKPDSRIETWQMCSGPVCVCACLNEFIYLCVSASGMALELSVSRLEKEHFQPNMAGVLCSSSAFHF